MAARITARDRELLAFLAEHRLVLREHVQVALGISADAANARLRTLRRADWIRWQAPQYDGHCSGYQIRSSGLAAIGSPLPPPRRPDPRGYPHDVGVAWLWLAARAGSFGAIGGLTSEREMRSRDGRDGDHEAPFGIRLGGTGRGGRERRHYPDLLLRTAGGKAIAVELELTRKSRTRLETILAGYGVDGRVDGVLYLVHTESHAREIAAAASRVGVSSLVHVQLFRWGGSMRSFERNLSPVGVRAHGRASEAGR
ncbi:MAG TPA: hypothetical protein VMU39_17170 [Solirubrobacteraceae bacterium]|nr:hypothetical protein [Solirubrobacteraceae bacterium]